MRTAVVLLFVLAVTGAVARAQDVPAAHTTSAVRDSVVETLEVERDETKAPKQPSLRFLKDHRVFVRSQLDKLSTRVTREHTSNAALIDERFLHLQEMSEAIAAARDTIGAEQALASERALFASVGQLATLEASLNLMDSLLTDQRNRLLWLERDFLGHQETSLVIVIRGVPDGNVPERIVISEELDITRVELTAEQCASLAQGGIAQIYHEFVEPRAHSIEVRLEGNAWSASPASVVTLDAARDRLTFLELDLSRLDREQANQGLVTRVWYR